jgi:hypothetical protein
MKTIKVLTETNNEWKNLKIGTILRVNDKAAKQFVDSNDAQYVSKSEWKEQETNNKKEK